MGFLGFPVKFHEFEGGSSEGYLPIPMMMLSGVISMLNAGLFSLGVPEFFWGPSNF